MQPWKSEKKKEGREATLQQSGICLCRGHVKRLRKYVSIAARNKCSETNYILAKNKKTKQNKTKKHTKKKTKNKANSVFVWKKKNKKINHIINEFSMLTQKKNTRTVRKLKLYKQLRSEHVNRWCANKTLYISNKKFCQRHDVAHGHFLSQSFPSLTLLP